MGGGHGRTLELGTGCGCGWTSTTGDIWADGGGRASGKGQRGRAAEAIGRQWWTARTLGGHGRLGTAMVDRQWEMVRAGGWQAMACMRLLPPLVAAILSLYLTEVLQWQSNG